MACKVAPFGATLTINTPSATGNDMARYFRLQDSKHPLLPGRKLDGLGLSGNLNFSQLVVIDD
jgi:hypothetical protein